MSLWLKREDQLRKRMISSEGILSDSWQKSLEIFALRTQAWELKIAKKKSINWTKKTLLLFLLWFSKSCFCERWEFFGWPYLKEKTMRFQRYLHKKEPQHDLWFFSERLLFLRKFSKRHFFFAFFFGTSLINEAPLQVEFRFSKISSLALYSFSISSKHIIIRTLEFLSPFSITDDGKKSLKMFWSSIIEKIPQSFSKRISELRKN